MVATNPVTSKATTRIARTCQPCIEPSLTSCAVPPSADGSPDTILTKMMIEMPLPIPRSEICSPSHIRNMVPVTSDTVAVNTKPGPGLIAMLLDCRAMDAPIAWKVARASVP